VPRVGVGKELRAQHLCDRTAPRRGHDVIALAVHDQGRAADRAGQGTKRPRLFLRRRPDASCDSGREQVGVALHAP
jgi:hypothetical protein